MVFEQRPRKRSHVSEAIAAAATRRLTADLPPFPKRPTTLPDTATVVLTLPQPAPVISINKTAGRSHHTTQSAKVAWRDAGRELCAGHIDELSALRGQRVEVTVALPVTDNRRRDPHNYTSTVVKWLVDGMVLSQVVVPDDHSLWLAVAEPVLWRGDHVRVRFRPALPLEDPAGWE